MKKKFKAIIRILKCDSFLVGTAKDGYLLIDSTMTLKQVRSMATAMHRQADEMTPKTNRT